MYILYIKAWIEDSYDLKRTIALHLVAFAYATNAELSKRGKGYLTFVLERKRKIKKNKDPPGKEEEEEGKEDQAKRQNQRLNLSRKELNNLVVGTNHVPLRALEIVTECVVEVYKNK